MALLDRLKDPAARAILVATFVWTPITAVIGCYRGIAYAWSRACSDSGDPRFDCHPTSEQVRDCAQAGLGAGVFIGIALGATLLIVLWSEDERRKY